MELTREEIFAIVESLLFTWGDPLEIADIASILEISKTKAEKYLLEMINLYDREKRGLRIEKRGNKYQLGTRPEYFNYIKQLNKPSNARNLSNAALETLSIIAYKQPVIKSEIEGIRGVKCDSAIYGLLEKELIEERGRLDRIGRPILYGTTDLFLQVFGLESLEDLPELKDSLNTKDKEEINREVEEKLSKVSEGSYEVTKVHS